MGRINNKELYGIDNQLSLDDFLIGSDAETITLGGEKTKNYLLRGIFNTFKSALNLSSIEFIFSDGTDPSLDHTDPGYFTTNGNNTSAPAVNTIYINKLDLNNIDVSSILEAVNENPTSFTIRLFKPSAANQVFYFAVSAVVDNTTHYAITVSNFVGGNTLVDGTTYGLVFDLSGTPSIYAETDPVFTASAAFGITAGQITNWDTAFGWGDHSVEGYLTAASNTTITGTWSFDAMDEIQFTPKANPAYSEGLLWYSSADKALSYYLDEADVTLNIGEEIIIRVRNTTGATITNGSVVYASGATGNRVNISLAQANSLATARVLGVATHDIENNSDGYVTVSGVVNGLDTSGFTAGDELFLSPTVAGGLINVKPQSPNETVVVGVCLVSNPSVGNILVQLRPLADTAVKALDQTIGGNWTFSNPLTVEGGSITLAKINQWDTAVTWGDHALEGYITAETDPVFSASAAAGISAAQILNWNAAYSWGNHALVGYVKADGTVPMTGILQTTTIQPTGATDTVGTALLPYDFGYFDNVVIGDGTAADPFIQFSGTVAKTLTMQSATGILFYDGFVVWHDGNFPLDITAAAKGDILVFNGTDWVDLTVGANDSVLTADSAQATGLKWATPVATLAGLTDTTITAAVKGDILVYNGSAWVDLTVGTDTQLLSANSATATGLEWVAAPTSAVWGSITGTLSNQTDLQTALDTKLNDTTDTFTGTLTVAGILQINSTSANPIQMNGTGVLGDNSSAAYLRGRDSAGANFWYVGNGSASHNDVILYSYVSNTWIGLDDAGGAYGLRYNHGGGTYNVAHEGMKPQSGAWWSDGPAWVEPTGVMEIGRYIDFHTTDTAVTDYDIRLDAASDQYLRAQSSGTQIVIEAYQTSTEFSRLAANGSGGYIQLGGTGYTTSTIRGYGNSDFEGGDVNVNNGGLSCTGRFTFNSGTQGYYFENASHRSGLIEIGASNSGYSWYGIQIADNGDPATGQLWNLMGNGSQFGLYDDTNNEWQVVCTANSSVAIYFNGSQKFVTTNTGITVTGTGVATDWQATSDARLKTEIQTLQREAPQVEWKQFHINGENRMRYGIIAQEVMQTHPELVSVSDEGIMSVSYNDYFVLKLAEKDRQIEELRKDIELLKLMMK